MNTRALRLPSLATEHPLERLARVVFIALLALLSVLYVYLISASTFNIIERKQAESESTAVEARLARINAEYYARSHSFTEESAVALGLLPLEEKAYVTRAKGLGLAE